MDKRRDAPVGSGGERDGFGTDTHGEDLSGVGPRYGSHRDGETAHEGYEQTITPFVTES